MSDVKGRKFELLENIALADLMLAQIAVMEAIKKYNPNQPRAPRGSSEGGRWIAVGVGFADIGNVHQEAMNQDVQIDATSVAFKKPKVAKNHAVSEKGIQFIADYEKFVDSKYIDQAGYSTIGYGHKIKPNEKFVGKITENEARQLLAKDLLHAELSVRRNVKVKITQSQYDALVAFTFNVGTGAFSRSDLLAFLNEEDYVGASDEFLKWNKVKKRVKKHIVYVVSSGLTKRRNSERELFLNGKY